MIFVANVAGVQVGTALPTILVDAKDAAGNSALDSSTVTLTLNSGTFSKGSTTVSATFSFGRATFSNLIVSSTGSYTLTATDGSLTPAISNQFGVYAPTTFASFGNLPLGANPQSMLVADSAGNLFGTTSAGGANSDGTIFEIPNGGSAVIPVADFNADFRGR